jgi:hypothetical protein
MRKGLKYTGLAIVAAAGIFLTNNQAQAATANGTTTLKLTVPAYVVLYYPGALNIVLADVGSTQTSTASVAWTENDADPTPSLTVSSSGPYSGAKALTVPNVWAIRGVSSSGNATVAITGTTGTSTTVSNSGKNIPISGLNVSSGAVTAGSSISVPLNGMTPVYGNVGMTLDMTALNSGTSGVKSGDYTGGQYSISVTVN